MKFATLGATVTVLIALAGSAEARTLETVASFSVLADVVSRVGGDHVHVTSLIGPNSSPHAYEPKPDDARKLKSADIVFISGFGLEGWFERLVQASGYQGHPIVASQGVSPRERERKGKVFDDPHVWNDPANGIIWTRNIVEALSAADPEDAAAFRANGAGYITALQAIDARAKAVFGAIPPEKRKILTSHDAFGYFGRAYGVTFLAPQGFSTETEASASDVAGLITQIKKEGIKAYFLENSTDPRLVRQIAEATGAQPGGTLCVEALSTKDGPAPTYLKMLDNDIDQLSAAMTR